MLKSTQTIRRKIQSLLFDKANEIYGLNECTDRMWRRYLRCHGIVSGRRKNYFVVEDPCFNRSLSVPTSLAEKMVLLESAPPFPPVETLKELVLRGTVQEYSLDTHKISVYEIVTDEHLFLFHSQNLFDDYPTKKAIEEIEDQAEFILPLSSQVLSIKDNKATIKYNFDDDLNFFDYEVKTVDIFYEWMVKPEFCTK